MLKIGRNGSKIQYKEVLDEGYTDITCVSVWLGVIEKYNYDRDEAYKQIELFIESLGDNVDKYNKLWYKNYLEISKKH